MTHRVMIRPAEPADLPLIWQAGFSDPQAAWRQWNGPYFQDKLPSREAFLTQIGPQEWLDRQRNWPILVDDAIIGNVNVHFVDAPLNRWLEVGILLYADQQWGRGIGRQALTQWLDHLWTVTDLPHIGLTTWSGNQRMMALAERCGLRLEARVPQVRYWQGRYWDSVKYGILREDWRK